MKPFSLKNCSFHARSMIFLLFFMIIGPQFAQATEFVKARRLYHGGDQPVSYFEEFSKAAAAEAIKCNASMYYPTSDCKFTYKSESWGNGVWYAQVQQTYTTRIPGYPDQFSSIAYNLHMIFECPMGFVQPDLQNQPYVCSRPDRDVPDCTDCETKIGNPIVISTGVKEQTEDDYASGSNTLKFTRVYRSDRNRWSNNYEMYAASSDNLSNIPRPDGNCYNDVSWVTHETYCYEYLNNGTFKNFSVRRGNGPTISFGDTGDFLPGKGTNDRVSPVVDGSGNQTAWSVTNAAEKTNEVFDMSGRLLTSTAINGQTTTFSYSDAATPPEISTTIGKLVRVTDAFGRQLNFTYDVKGKMATMIDPAGGIFGYSYDVKGNLQSVTYPDGKKRTYVYSETSKTSGANLPFALTGIIDENEKRYATFSYAGNGKAISTEHAGGVEKYIATYPSAWQTNLTEPLGAVKQYQFWPVLGVVKHTGMTQPGSNGTGTASTTISYDANGNVSSRTNLNGIRTNYTYDMDRNLELSRVEGGGTAQARSITTTWHPTLRLPASITEPGRTTTFSYDAGGNLLQKSVAAGGAARIWRYTYNDLGQVLTATGPRTDVANVTRFSYDAQGNLATITNPGGHVTALSNYDANGRVGLITDPNGLATELSYSPRGWLVSSNVDGERTTYTYDGVGQMSQVTRADGSAINFTYDDAHRLTAIADGQGNTITYTLDAMSNRIGEQVNDPNGVLARKTTRIYDLINQLQQVTGAQQ